MVVVEGEAIGGDEYRGGRRQSDRRRMTVFGGALNQTRIISRRSLPLGRCHKRVSPASTVLVTWLKVSLSFLFRMI
jgi:hypothetical protein